MGRIDRSYVYNAALRDHSKPRVVYYNGKNRENPNGPPERRRMLWPAGTVERYVNLQGSVVQCVLVPPGVPASKEGLAQARAKLHAHKTTDKDVVGFIEHGKCPLKTGVADLDETIADEMERARNACGPACKEHPVTFKKTAKGIEYFDGCPHVQWLIKERREIHRAKVEARMKRQSTIHEMEQAKLAAAEQQARDTRALLERVVDKMDRADRPAKKASPE
jgi:hypothetical protein